MSKSPNQFNNCWTNGFLEDNLFLIAVFRNRTAADDDVDLIFIENLAVTLLLRTVESGPYFSCDFFLIFLMRLMSEATYNNQ